MSYSCDTSSNASSLTAASNISGSIKNLNALSPKLQSYFSRHNNNNQQNYNTENISPKNKGKDYTNLLFSPETQYLNETTDTNRSDDNNNEDDDVLHSIFSPGFKSKSAKKKKKSSQYQQQQSSAPFNSIFSPVSTSTEVQEVEEEISTTNNSEMSDEYSTIHAILRGDSMESIKKHVGLDNAHHPLLSNNNNSNSMGNGLVRNVGTEIDSKVAVNQPLVSSMQQLGVDTAPLKQPVVAEESSIGDSTMDMLDKARFFTGKQGSSNQGMALAITSPPSQEPTSSTKEKTPRVSPTTSTEDEFYTPTSVTSAKKKPSSSGHRASLASSPMSLNFDVGRMSSGGGKNNNGLPPVWEEDNNVDKSNETGEEDNDSPVNMGDFRTPKQHNIDWKEVNDYSDVHDNQEEEEEFFSPLAQHTRQTTSSSTHDAANDSHHNYLLGSTLTLDFDVEDLNNNSQLSVSQAEVPSTDIPPVASSAAPTKQQSPSSSSPRFKEMKQGLQSLLKEAKDLKSPEKAPIVREQVLPYGTKAAATPSYQQATKSNPIVESPSFHLHSPSVSSLPHDALTVDFVKSCYCVETLQAILTVLTDDNGHTHRNNGKRGKQLVGGKQLRYPSLVRLAEKRLQNMQKEQCKDRKDVAQAKVETSEQLVQVRPRVALSRGKTLRPPGTSQVDKENVDPSPERPSEIPRPMESITVLHNSNDGDDEEINDAVNEISPLVEEGNSLSVTKSSLDMDLSVSMLDDESLYWKQTLDINTNEKNTREEVQHVLAQKTIVPPKQSHNKASQTTQNDDILQSYEKAKEKLASTMVSNTQLTREMDSLVNEHREVKAELSKKLQQVSKQLTKQRAAAATQKDAQQRQIAELDGINSTLQEEVQQLHQQLHLVNQHGQEAANQLQLELEEVRVQHLHLSQDKETLEEEMNGILSRYEKAQREVARLKLLLDKKNSTPEKKNTEKLRQIVDSAKLANKALANALAVSEKDLAEAYEAKDKSSRECNALRDHTTKLEDKTSFLSSKVKELYTELKSSHAYIDQLYADLTANRSPSKEIKADFERKEMEWIELERGYSQRKQQLEQQLRQGSDSKNKVSMEAYMSVVKSTRHYKMECTKLKQQLESMQNPSPVNSEEDRPTPQVVRQSTRGSGGGKTLRTLQSIKSKQLKLSKNDENVAPTNAREHSTARRIEAVEKQQKGKQLNHKTIRALGGKKGLQEQLKRVRQGGKMMIR